MPTPPNSTAVDTPPVDSSQTSEQAQVVRRAVNVLTRLRYFRRQYDTRRAYYYRQYIGFRDRRLFPDNLTPRSNTFVPFPHKNVETIVSRVMDAFFALDPYFEARKRGVTGEGDADAMQWVMLTGLHRANLQTQVEQLVRNICIYGFSGISVDWDFDYDVVDGPEPIYFHAPIIDPQTGQPVIDPQTGQPQLQPMPYLGQDGQPIQMGTRHVTKKVPRNCPKISCIDVYDLMVDPDGTYVARAIEKTLGQMKREAETNPTLYDTASFERLVTSVTALHKENPDGVLIRLAELWDNSAKTVTLITFGDDAEATTWKDLRYSYRNANYSSFKRHIYTGSPVLLHYGPNPFAHKRANILYTSYTKLPNEVYGIGVVEKSSDLSDGVNNFVNMIADNWNAGINKRYAYDTQADIDHEALNMANVPSGKVAVTGDPSKVLFPLPSFTPAQGDYAIIDLYKGMIDMVTGVSDLNSSAGMAQASGSTGVGVSQVLSESNYLFRMFIRNLEEDILQPLLEMVSSMYQQFGTDELEFEITGAPPEIPKYGRVPLEKLLGSYDFDFVGANYATDKVVRQRQLMAFYGVASQSPYLNQGMFLRELGKVMGIANATRLLKPDQQVAMETQQAQQTQAQMAVLEKLLDTESKTLIAQIRNAKHQGGEQDAKQTAHATAAQEEIERILYEDVFERLGLEQPPGQPAPPKNPGGRPAHMQHEGKIPGQNLEGIVRSQAQSQGANGLGLEGINNNGSE